MEEFEFETPSLVFCGPPPLALLGRQAGGGRGIVSSKSFATSVLSYSFVMEGFLKKGSSTSQASVL